MNMTALAKYFSTLCDLLFPPACLVCGSIGEIVCSSCLASISRTIQHSKTKEPLPVISLLPYADPIKHLIWSCKFRNRKALVPLLARLIADHFPQELKDSTVIIPVPIHAQRLRERGFNQAEEFIRESSDRFDIPLRNDVLVRTAETHALYTLDKGQRKQTMEHVMHCAIPEAVQGKSVLLFDDIITTGATLTACTSALRSQGAANVRALTLCRA